MGFKESIPGANPPFTVLTRNGRRGSELDAGDIPCRSVSFTTCLNDLL